MLRRAHENKGRPRSLGWVYSALRERVQARAPFCTQGWSDASTYFAGLARAGGEWTNERAQARMRQRAQRCCIEDKHMTSQTSWS